MVSWVNVWFGRELQPRKAARCLRHRTTPQPAHLRRRLISRRRSGTAVDQLRVRHRGQRRHRRGRHGGGEILALVEDHARSREATTRRLGPGDELQPLPGVKLQALLAVHVHVPLHPAMQGRRVLHLRPQSQPSLERRLHLVRRVQDQRQLDNEQQVQLDGDQDVALAVLARHDHTRRPRRPHAVVALRQDHVDRGPLPRIQHEAGGLSEIGRLPARRSRAWRLHQQRRFLTADQRGAAGVHRQGRPPPASPPQPTPNDTPATGPRATATPHPAAGHAHRPGPAPSPQRRPPTRAGRPTTGGPVPDPHPPRRPGRGTASPAATGPRRPRSPAAPHPGAPRSAVASGGSSTAPRRLPRGRPNASGETLAIAGI